MTYVATINAFANKFGGFTGAIRNEATKEIIRERFETYDEAKNFVRSKAWEIFGPVNYASMPRKGEYLANVWRHDADVEKLAENIERCIAEGRANRHASAERAKALKS